VECRGSGLPGAAFAVARWLRARLRAKPARATLRGAALARTGETRAGGRRGPRYAPPASQSRVRKFPPRRRACETRPPRGGTATSEVDCFETRDTEAIRDELDFAGSLSPFIRVPAEPFSFHIPVVAAKMRLLPEGLPSPANKARAGRVIWKS
jgi:hypothetical protein